MTKESYRSNVLIFNELNACSQRNPTVFLVLITLLLPQELFEDFLVIPNTDLIFEDVDVVDKELFDLLLIVGDFTALLDTLANDDANPL